MPLIVRFKKPLSKPELTRVEATLGVSIPEGYRNFLLATDGGKPVDYMVTRELGLTRFLGAREIAKARTRLRERLPETLLPIADAAGGNYVCISTAAADLGAIYYWDHELEPLGKAAQRIASSFDEFVSELRVWSRTELGPARVISVEIDPEFLRTVKEQEALEDQQPTLQWPPDARRVD